MTVILIMWLMIYLVMRKKPIINENIKDLETTRSITFLTRNTLSSVMIYRIHILLKTLQNLSTRLKLHQCCHHQFNLNQLKSKQPKFHLYQLSKSSHICLICQRSISCPSITVMLSFIWEKTKHLQ